MAVLGELCLRPLKIDMQQNALKFFDYIAQNNNKLLQDVLDECQERNSVWFDDIIKLINESNFNVNKLLLKNHSDKKQCKNLTLKNNKVIRKHCQVILNKKFDQEWQEEISKMERLKFYKEIKNKPLLDLYLTKLESRTGRNFPRPWRSLVNHSHNKPLFTSKWQMFSLFACMTCSVAKLESFLNNPVSKTVFKKSVSMRYQ